MEGTAKGAFSASGCERLGEQLEVKPSVEPPHRVVVFGQRETPPTLHPYLFPQHFTGWPLCVCVGGGDSHAEDCGSY